MPTQIKLTPVQREVLEKLAAGHLMTANRHFEHYVDGQPVQSQTFYFLVNRRLVRVFDPSRKSDAKGNGHVISDRGLDALREGASKASAPTSSSPTSVPGRVPLETCAECDKTISARARANIFDDRIVCTACLTKLSTARAEEQRKVGPASAAQVSYACGLGLAFPAEISWLEMRDVLSRHLDYSGDVVAPEWLREMAVAYKLDDVTRFSGTRQLFDRIFRTLSDECDELLAEWFVWNVAREAAPRIGACDSNVIRAVAAEVAGDATVMSSIRRYRGEDLLDFGESTDTEGWVNTGGSLRTIAYRSVIDRLKKRCV